MGDPTILVMMSDVCITEPTRSVAISRDVWRMVSSYTPRVGSGFTNLTSRREEAKRCYRTVVPVRTAETDRERPH